MKSAKMSIDRWTYNENIVHIHHGILVSPKEKLGYKICRKLDGSVK